MKYKDGEKTIVVPSNATVVNLVPGSKADLKPGKILGDRRCQGPPVSGIYGAEY